MRARTKFQKRVVAADSTLPSISKAAVKWAYEHCASHLAYRTGSGKTTCLCCGGSFFMTDKGTDKARCPHCGRELKVVDTYRHKWDEKVYFSVVTTHKGLQVHRTAILCVNGRKGQSAEYHAFEVVRYWMDEQGRTEVVARARSYGYGYDSINWTSDMELRKDNDIYHWMADSYVYPQYRVLPVLRRDGIKGAYPKEVQPLELMHSLLNGDARIETLLKMGHTRDLNFFMQDRYFRTLDNVWQSYKITMRNGYDIPDIQLWCDYIRLLGDCGKDTRNAFYVCPSDLRAEHDRYLHIKKEKDMKRQRDIQRRKAMEAEAAFEKMKGKFFGLHFTDGIVVVSVLESVDAYYEEGNAMHHCVGDMEYYKKPDSLVFSARINGERVETVEVSLKTFKVLQSRGACNRNTQYHKEIIDLVNRNMNLIRKAV